MIYNNPHDALISFVTIASTGNATSFGKVYENRGTQGTFNACELEVGIINNCFGGGQ